MIHMHYALIDGSPTRANVSVVADADCLADRIIKCFGARRMVKRGRNAAFSDCDGLTVVADDRHYSPRAAVDDVSRALEPASHVVDTIAVPNRFTRRAIFVGPRQAVAANIRTQ